MENIHALQVFQNMNFLIETAPIFNSLLFAALQ